MAPHVPVPQQAAFPGSERLLRGRLLRELSRAGDYTIPLALARTLADGHDLAGVLDRLEREGLVRRRGARLQLGSGGAPATASTIGP